MYRYVIYVYIMKNNNLEIIDYDARHFEVNNFSLDIYPTDFSECVHIPLTDVKRLAVNPYNYTLRCD